MFNKVTIIGMGLIGSSLARIILKKRLAKTLIAADTSLDVCKKVHDLGLAHIVTDQLLQAVEDSDLVVLAVPVGAMKSVAERIAPALKDGAVVTDTGSVKMAVIEAIGPHCRPGVDFVPGHPIAGTEFSGPEAGFAELFENRWCVLTPLPDTSIRSVEKVTKLWEEAGAMIEIMDPAHHDLVLGITSHLPHLIAYTIVGTATELEDDIKSEVIKFSASGFRDFTRIAASDPVMWRDIFLNNKAAVLEVLQRFSEDLTALQKAIRQGNGDYLYDVFTKTRAIRKQIVQIGQAE
ncbi:MAG: prephenate/arogenate dehydrogenase family protein [Rhodospirillales bacterium]|nr:prephenate/arogenate dehydrogenase family protein [Alphaproteobacteria bacterium]MCB1839581.1 prephenate/arogenate dehydrogenase family protein [Alphaproteobacteria bacterium]MCB9976724.1 prephenate/arogenate dehydrogenase family protein [Rhodospirillales bacterium]